MLVCAREREKRRGPGGGEENKFPRGKGCEGFFVPDEEHQRSTGVRTGERGMEEWGQRLELKGSQGGTGGEKLVNEDDF